MAGAQYRSLADGEVAALQQSGCRAENWHSVSVCDPFDPRRFHDVVFEGTVQLGRMDGMLRCRDGAERPCGITRAVLRNVSVGSGCLITNVTTALARVDVGERVEIENVGRIACTGESSFGNGVKVEALNEGGGREVPITTLSSAQVAYLTAMYRHDSTLVTALNTMAREHTRAARAERARVGSGSYVANCGEIIDVAIGECATVNGAQLLRDGTVDSSVEAPTHVGAGVIAERFIFQKGAVVKDGCMISRSLIGEATQVGKQCSIENSLLFCNSEAFHSELCSVFGGPYTVTHHRSTLLIAGYFSFYNAGSGTNQSNHMYKLGPLHQGIVERGGKTGSFSYLLWPARVGAFSVVIGKHYSNFDASEFPFSYLNEEDGKSVLTPAMNLFTVGTMRDGAKWPSRDRRKGGEQLDQIVFNVLSPYTAQAMVSGRATLMKLYEGCERGREFVTYRGMHLKRLLLKTCARYYTLGLNKYYGDLLASRVSSMKARSLRAVLGAEAEGEPGEQPWVDLCGLLCPKSRVDQLLGDIAQGRVADLPGLLAALRQIRERYERDEWNWFLAHYKSAHGTELSEASDEELQRLVGAWAEATRKLLSMVAQDAQKEFEETAKTGYGIDGEGEADFAAVRGSYDSNSFVAQLKQQITEVAGAHERLRSLI